MSLISLPALDGLIVLKYLERYGLEDQLGRIRSFLRPRRDTLGGALKGKVPGEVRVPAGGCFLRLALPEGTRATPLARRLVRDFGVSTVPEGAFWPPSERETPDRFLRLAFSWSDPEELALAADRIGRGLGEELRERAVPCRSA
jgi:DNA-binding transcriptional MocR family regulator